MKKWIAVGILLALMLNLAGCAKEKQLAADALISVADTSFFLESSSSIPADAFSFARENADSVNFDSYFREVGTSSVNNSILIYRYEDTLIAVQNYFFGGDAAMQTFTLTQEQGAEFLDLIAAYKKKNQENKDLPVVGGNYDECVLHNGKDSMNIEPLDLSSLDLPLKSEQEFELSSERGFTLPTEQSNEYVQKSMCTSAPALYNCIGDQIESVFGSPIESVDSMIVGDIDTLMMATLKNGSVHSFLVTNHGLVVRTKGEDYRNSEQSTTEEIGLLPSAISTEDDNIRLEDYLDFTQAWTIEEYMGNDHIVTTYAFNEDGSFYILGGWWYSEAFLWNTGTYSVEGTIVHFRLNDSDETSYSYKFDPYSRQFTQTSSVGLYFTHKKGSVFQLVQDRNWDVEDLKKLVETELAKQQ